MEEDIFMKTKKLIIIGLLVILLVLLLLHLLTGVALIVTMD